MMVIEQARAYCKKSRLIGLSLKLRWENPAPPNQEPSYDWVIATTVSSKLTSSACRCVSVFWKISASRVRAV
jgi:hypothetical protein